MGKKKKNWRRQINPEKSNKMIYAVGIGLLLLFSVFIFLTIEGGSPEKKEEWMSSVLNYLKKTQGIIDVEVIPEHNRVKILYDSHDKKNFIKIARYAGLKLSYKLKAETLEIQLINENHDQLIYSVVLRNGTIIKEDRFPQ
jgi:hypothetical protein